MEQSFIVWTNPETGDCTITSIPYDRPNAKEFWVKRVVPEGVDWLDIHPIEIPDRTFRNAWEQDFTEATKKIRINMEKAREIHMEKIRIERNKQLAEKDTEYQIALEKKDSDEMAKIATEKQALRDLPETFGLEQYATPEELKKAWPTELNG